MKSQMQNFDFLFGVSLGYEILRHTDNLSRTLQRKDLSAAEGQCLTELALSTLAKSPSADSGHLYTKMVDEQDINKPTLPWCRKVPKGFEPGNTPPEFPTSIGSSNLVVNCVKNHFKQLGYQLYHHLEDVLLKCMHGDKSYQEDIEFISKFYSGDLENSSLSTHLETFTMLVRNNHWSR